MNVLTAARRWSRGVLATGLLVGAARADPPPRVTRMVWSEDGRSVLLIGNRGIIHGDVAAKEFRLMCPEALHLRVGDVPGVALLRDGRWMTATTFGLKVSSDGGCSWQGVAPLDAIQTPALQQHPTQPSVLYVATFGTGQSGIQLTRDGGATFTSALSLADNEFTHSLAIAASNPERVYATGIAFDDTGNFTHYVVRSSDGGQTWERFPLGLGILDERGTLVAVHPGNEEEILLRTTALDPTRFPERLLVSRDGGQSFTEVFQGELVAGATYGTDGSEAWLANTAGVWRSSDAMGTFTRQGTAERMSAVQEHGGQLWGAGRFAGTAEGKDGIGVSTDGGQSFSEWMDVRDVREPLACDPSSETTVLCGAAWLHWQVEILGLSDAGVAPGADGGTATGGAGGARGAGGSPAGAGGAIVGSGGRDGFGGGRPRESRSSSCALAHGGQRPSTLAVVLSVLGAFGVGACIAGRRRARYAVRARRGQPERGSDA